MPTLSSLSVVPSGFVPVSQFVFPSVRSFDLTLSGLALCFDRYNAAAPATCGEAILVPLIVL